MAQLSDNKTMLKYPGFSPDEKIVQSLFNISAKVYTNECFHFIYQQIIFYVFAKVDTNVMSGLFLLFYMHQLIFMLLQKSTPMCAFLHFYHQNIFYAKQSNYVWHQFSSK